MQRGSRAERAIMAEEKTAAQTAAEEAAEAQSPYMVTFPKTYTFEKKEYTEVDLSGLESLKIKDLAEVQRKLSSAGETATNLLMETTTAFACELAARASKKPVEFFNNMPVKIFEEVQKAVSNAIKAGDSGEDAHVMKLDAPYTYEGKRESIKGESFAEVYFENAGGVTASDMAAAENKMAATGQPVTGIDRNYIYSCCIAARASNLPEDFFLELPACEGLKLLNVLNGDAFFE